MITWHVWADRVRVARVDCINLSKRYPDATPLQKMARLAGELGLCAVHGLLFEQQLAGATYEVELALWRLPIAGTRHERRGGLVTHAPGVKRSLPAMVVKRALRTWRRGAHTLPPAATHRLNKATNLAVVLAMMPIEEARRLGRLTGATDAADALALGWVGLRSIFQHPAVCAAPALGLSDAAYNTILTRIRSTLPPGAEAAAAAAPRRDYWVRGRRRRRAPTSKCLGNVAARVAASARAQRTARTATATRRRAMPAAT